MMTAVERPPIPDPMTMASSPSGTCGHSILISSIADPDPKYSDGSGDPTIHFWQTLSEIIKTS